MGVVERRAFKGYIINMPTCLCGFCGFLFCWSMYLFGWLNLEVGEGSDNCWLALEGLDWLLPVPLTAQGQLYSTVSLLFERPYKKCIGANEKDNVHVQHVDDSRRGYSTLHYRRSSSWWTCTRCSFTIKPFWYLLVILKVISLLWPVLCPTDQHFRAMSGLLKRKFEEVEEDPCYSSSSPSSLSSSAYSGWDSDGESCYSDTLDSTPSNPSSPAVSLSSEYGFRFIPLLSSLSLK